VGWCRGLKRVAGGKLLVGFTRLRPTRFQENVGWVKSRVKDLVGMVDSPDSGVFVPTHIIQLDVDKEHVDWTLDLEEYGFNAVFCIL